MTLTLRAVKGAPLTTAELDGNFTDHEGRLVALETATETPPTIDSDVSGSTWTLTINGTDFIHTIPQAAFAPPGISAVSGATMTLGTDNVNKYTRVSHLTGCAVTVPPQVDTPISVGSECHFRQADAGAITFVEGAGVTINPQFGCTLVTAGLGATVSLKKVSANEWDAVGQFEAV